MLFSLGFPGFANLCVDFLTMFSLIYDLRPFRVWQILGLVFWVSWFWAFFGLGFDVFGVGFKVFWHYFEVFWVGFVVLWGWFWLVLGWFGTVLRRFLNLEYIFSAKSFSYFQWASNCQVGVSFFSQKFLYFFCLWFP